MEVKVAGHVYELADKDGNEPARQTIVFSNREPNDRPRQGTTTQEILRVLIDRTRYCNNCLPHPNNERIIHHLRMALVLHEARALERGVEKGEYLPEFVKVQENGHFALTAAVVDKTQRDLLTVNLNPYTPDWEKKCKYPPVEK